MVIRYAEDFEKQQKRITCGLHTLPVTLSSQLLPRSCPFLSCILWHDMPFSSCSEVAEVSQNTRTENGS